MKKISRRSALQGLAASAAAAVGIHQAAGQTADHQGEKAAFNEILKTLPQTLPNSYAISSAGLPCNPDHLHFTPDGQRELGRRYAVKMLNLMGYEAKEPKEPYVTPQTGAAQASH
jgi:lysophospholipase L1-like esterase